MASNRLPRFNVNRILQTIQRLGAELCSLPWLPLALRDALLLLGLVIAMMSIDAPAPTWTLWWPLTLLAMASVLSVRMAPGLAIHWRELAAMLTAFIIIVWRGVVSLNGLAPVAGLREIQAAALIIFSSTTLYLATRRTPKRVLALWSGALAFNLLSLLMIGGKTASGASLDAITIAYRPAIEFTAFSLAASASIWFFGKVFGSRRRTSDPDAPEPENHLTKIGIALVLMAAGAAWGRYELTRMTALPIQVAIGIESSHAYVAQAWTQSIVLGWGPRTLSAVVQALAQPREIIMPPWTGFAGLLAQWGIAGVILFGCVVIWFVRQHASLKSATSGAVLLLFGWFLAAGPHALHPLLILGGWLALAFAGSPQKEPAANHFPFWPDRASAWALSLFSACGMILLFFPVLGSVLLRRADERKLHGDVYRERIMLAAELNPFDPQIPLALAGSLRRSMAQAESWSEAAYLRVLAYYRQAARLAPYDTLVPLRQAHFQAACDRQEEALETVKRALVRQPNARDLLAWIFATGIQNQNIPLAQAALTRGLQLEPENAMWWRWQFALARQTGQGGAAGEALRHTLSARPDDPVLLATAIEWLGANPMPQPVEKP